MSENDKRQDAIPGMNIFMGICTLSAHRSKDPSTQVGACIVSPDHKILSMGYNGFPKGCSDDIFPWAKMKAEQDPYNAKYFYVTHAELNAILNYRGGSLEGATIYVTLFPCNECAKAIIQSGIKTLVYWEDIYADTPAVKAPSACWMLPVYAITPTSPPEEALLLNFKKCHACVILRGATI